MLPQELREMLQKQGYYLVGRHSAVKTCEWLRKSIRGDGVCYKQDFYGIDSHRCLQMTPAVAHCTQRCIFCWRPTEWTVGNELTEYDDPDFIVEGCLEGQRNLISGFGGSQNADKEKFKEAQKPTQVAISLAGEPTAYPLIGELIDSFHRHGAESTFLVTNGTFPERLENISREPTQLYLSYEAPNKELFKKLDVPVIPDAWERVNKTIDLFPSFTARKAVRITLVKGYNDSDDLIPGFAAMLDRAQPDFVEVKSYMCIGFSRKRLSLDNMLTHEEILDYSKKLAAESGYTLADDKPISRVALLKK